MTHSDVRSGKHGNRWIFDYLATLWLFTMIVPGSYIGYNYINPVVFKDHPYWMQLNSNLIYYGLFMLSTNWLLIRLTSNKVPECYKLQTKNSDCNEQLDFCKHCNHYKPSRCHHCNLCKRCILKQDHHCFFTSTCIGYENQRFFIVFTFWMGLGFVYSFFIAIVYSMSSEWRTLPLYDYVLLPLSFLRYLFGYLTSYEIFCLFVAHSLCVAIYAANFLFITQIYLMYWGLTSFENKKGLQSPVSHLPLTSLLKLTFGPLWFINFIFPIGLFTSVPGNGCDWKFTL